MEEFQFIESIRQSFYRNQQIIRGIGDDAAVYRQPYQDIVTAVDTFVEGVHFSKKTMDPFHVGYRVLAANISDMAAMGAEPISYLISIVVPTSWTDHELKEVYRGLNTIAKEFKIDLIGGDTVSGEQLVLTVTINGAVERDKARYRNAMQAEDVIFVTGTLGDSAAGLSILLTENKTVNETDYLIKRHRMPSPRVAFASGLSELNRVALNDISDGIASEANELAQASNLTVYLEQDKLPVSKQLNQFDPQCRLNYVLSGGEDFELIGSVAKQDWDKVVDIAEQTQTPVTKVGTVLDQPSKNGYVYLYHQGQYKQLKPSGYVHRN